MYICGEKQKPQQEEHRKVNVSVDQKAIQICNCFCRDEVVSVPDQQQEKNRLDHLPLLCCMGSRRKTKGSAFHFWPPCLQMFKESGRKQGDTSGHKNVTFILIELRQIKGFHSTWHLNIKGSCKDNLHFCNALKYYFAPPICYS